MHLHNMNPLARPLPATQGFQFKTSGRSLPIPARLGAALRDHLAWALNPVIVGGPIAGATNLESPHLWVGEFAEKPSLTKTVIQPILICQFSNTWNEDAKMDELVDDYLKLGCLREIYVAHGRTRKIEVFRRAVGGIWIESEYQWSESVTLDSVGFTFAMDSLDPDFSRRY